MIFTVEREPGLAGLRIGFDFEADSKRRTILDENVFGPVDVDLPLALSGLELKAQPTFLELSAGFASREEVEGTLGSEQVGDAHRGELGAVELVGREGDRYAQDGAPDKGLP